MLVAGPGYNPRNPVITGGGPLFNLEFDNRELESDLSRTMRTAGDWLQRYAKARSASAVASQARPEREYIPSGMLPASWVWSKMLGEQTSWHNLTKRLPKVREGEVIAWRKSTGAMPSQVPTMNQISAFRRSHVLSPVTGTYVRSVQQDDPIRKHWQRYVDNLQPTIRPGSAADNILHFVREYRKFAYSLDHRSRYFREAAETLGNIAVRLNGLNFPPSSTGTLKPRTGRPGFQPQISGTISAELTPSEETYALEVSSIPDATWSVDVAFIEEAVALRLLGCLLGVLAGYMSVADFINDTSALIDNLQAFYTFLRS